MKGLSETEMMGMPEKEYQEVKLINRERGYMLCLKDLDDVLFAVATPDNVGLINRINNLMKLNEEIRIAGNFNSTRK